MSTDFSCFVTDEHSGEHTLYLQVEGMRCASCAWRIEASLNAIENVKARINFSTERLRISWHGVKEQANELADNVEALGFHVAPFSATHQREQSKEEERFLLRCLAVSGFASGNLMMFSLALWFSSGEAMGPATRDFMHWIMALISLPAIIYAGRPFFYSAASALRIYRTNMDVPISLAVILAAIMSLHETIFHGPYVYFDASVMLLFFLLAGRYLDKKARGRAREAAQGLLAMLEGTATILKDGAVQSIIIRDIAPDMHLLVSGGEKIAADGVVLKGESEIDTSLVTGETMPRMVREGDKVYAGMINLSVPLEVRVSAASDQSLLADIVQLMEKAEQGQAEYVRIADRVAGWYTPVVHVLAIGAFLGWWLWMGAPWQQSLLIATAVLIITCPCALGLAVPVVQVLASSRLFKQGMLLKSGNALEKLACVDIVIFDKTGTLTLGVPTLTNRTEISQEDLQLAASLAVHSKHPLAKAVASAWKGEVFPVSAQEITAHGIEAAYQGCMIRLGKRSWCGNNLASIDEQLELWLDDGKHTPVRFTFEDALRSDAVWVVGALKAKGITTVLLSGDREAVAKHIAKVTGIVSYKAELTPVDKSHIIEEYTRKGHSVLMVGDGLNDAPALAMATVSMSPSSAVDITQNAADIVFRGEALRPVLEALEIAKRTDRLVKQNFILSLIYNILAVPLAIAGLVTPLIASIAMSSSSLLVIGNSFRLNMQRKP